MWKIARVCEGVYGFNAEPNLHDAYSATLTMKTHEHRLDIFAEIYMSYLHHIEEYENLLEEIRHFAKAVKREQKKELCTVNFHCQGLACFVGEKSLPINLDSYGLEVIDAMFKEEIA